MFRRTMEARLPIIRRGKGHQRIALEKWTIPLRMTVPVVWVVLARHGDLGPLGSVSKRITSLYSRLHSTSSAL